MGRVNNSAISNLQGNSSSTVKKNSNLGKNLIAIGLTAMLVVGTATPAVAHSRDYCNDNRYGHVHNNDCGYYSYVPYNPNWGIRDATYLVCVSVTRNNSIGVVKVSEAPSELLRAIYNCIGEKKVTNSDYKYVTFNINYEKSNDSYVIDINSFEIYKRNISNLGTLKNKDIFLPAKIFMSPEGQQWVDEANYITYVNDKVIVYECSNGSLVNSYDQFKTKENELAKKPNKPSTPNNQNQNISLNQIAYYELESDGTIWKDTIILEEYLSWKSDKNYNYKNGAYNGAYGTATTFVEYAKCYNLPYFINSGLKYSEQYYGANGFLYGSSEQANKSLETGYQKIK